jgi:sodium transport system permease protein
MTFVGVAILGLLDLEITRSLFPEQGGLPLSAVGITGGILVSLVAFFASLLVAISAASRNIRESQTYLGGLSFVVLLPAVFSQVIGFTGAENELWVAFTPILNSAMGLRAALAGEGLTPAAGGAVATNLTLALLCTILAVRLFRREGMVLRV